MGRQEMREMTTAEVADERRSRAVVDGSVIPEYDEVTPELDRIDKCGEVLSEVIDHLTERLSSVLADKRIPVPSTADVLGVPLCRLATNIRSIGDNLDVSTSRLRDVIDRLAL